MHPRIRWPATVLLLVVLARSALAFESFISKPGDDTRYCNAVQNKVGFIRYPLGEIGAWSTVSGEMADVMTRVPRIYPCVGMVVARGEKDDWRASISGDPSLLTIRYRTNSPAGASTLAMTVSSHVTAVRITFPEQSRSNYFVIDLSKGTVDTWARLNRWTNRVVTRIDERTLQAQVGEPGGKGAFYVIRFSEPCTSYGALDPVPQPVAQSGDLLRAGATIGANPAMYFRFEAKTVTAAIGASFTGFGNAEEFLRSEFSSFDSAQRECHEAWQKVLSRVAIEGSEKTKRMAYTALYTLIANVINATDGSYYANDCPTPRSIASSAYWQFIGGYQSCCWDNIRASYPFLDLAYPEVMTDILETYLARYKHDGNLDGDICLITGPLGHRNIRFVPVLVVQALESGVKADYAKLYAALKDNFDNDAYTPTSLRTVGHMIQPASGGFACSRSLEFFTGFDSMAILARTRHDDERSIGYARLSKGYSDLWDSDNHVFRLRNEDGTWGPTEFSKMTWNPNPQGLFEGTSKDWMFAVPHDPYGLMGLRGNTSFADRVIGYCTNECWFNDYQTAYPFLLYYAGLPNEAQTIIRRSWLGMFDEGIMYEGVRPKVPHNGWQTHYTGNSGWLLCAMLGLYPGSAPPGQFIISSPAVSKAVIHNGEKAITMEAINNSAENVYIHSIVLDGKDYPSYMIPAERLAAGANIQLQMGSDPAQALGDLYVGSSDGFVRKVELLSPTHLHATIQSAVSQATTKIYSRTRPAKVLVNGEPATNWGFDQTMLTATIPTLGIASVEVWLK